jgi:CheY-like chemotaxis protein
MAGERILIVDDHKEAARLIRRNLETLEQDFIIDDVFSAEEALLELSRGKTDLLVADVLLPGISGLELLERLKAKNPDAKVILVSGVTDPKIRREVAQAGANAFFFKPIDMPEFLDAVERALGLVETSLTPELQLHAEDYLEEGEENRTQIGMTELITDLRISMNATAVMLVGEQGKVLVRAGDLPDPELETSLMPMLMRAFSSGVSISHFLGQNTPDHFYSFRGENYDLFLAPVGEAYCLMALTHPIMLQEVGSIANLMHNTAKTVLLSMARLGISTQPSYHSPYQTGALSGEDGRKPGAATADAPAEEDGDPGETLPGDQTLEDLLSAVDVQETEDVDAFWETLSNEEIKPDLSSSDSLSYDQAAKLGLAPSED